MAAVAARRREHAWEDLRADRGPERECRRAHPHDAVRELTATSSASLCTGASLLRSLDHRERGHLGRLPELTTAHRKAVAETVPALTSSPTRLARARWASPFIEGHRPPGSRPSPRRRPPGRVTRQDQDGILGSDHSRGHRAVVLAALLHLVDTLAARASRSGEAG